MAKRSRSKSATPKPSPPIAGSSRAKKRSKSSSEGNSSEPVELVVATIGEAARLMGVSVRTLAGWCTDPTFPGKPGTPGKQDGHFPIRAIRTWHLATFGRTASSRDDDEELTRARRLKALIDTDDAQVDLERKLGTIHDTLAAEQLIRRQINTAKALLEEMPDRVASRLPGKIPPAVRKTIRRAIDETIAETLNAIAEMAAGDTDETDDAPDEESSS